VVLEWKIVVLSTLTSAASDCALPLKGRLIRAFLRALVGAFKAGKTFVPRTTGLDGVIGREISEVEDAPLRAFAGLAASRHSRRRETRGPDADISTLFGQAVGQCPIQGRCRG
jgi:hypothetical protein